MMVSLPQTERYNLAPYVTAGATTVNVRTNNPTDDDNIFLAIVHTSGRATVTTPAIPEPSTYLMLGSGLLGLIALRRRSAR